MTALLAPALAVALAGAPADQTFRLADGVAMSYLDGGKGEPALVFVHCGNCRKEIWRETLAAFSGTHRVVAMDLPGHGASGANRKEWSMPALGADVAALVEHLKLPRVILVGNSLGGPVSLEAARRLGPKRVLGVVAVDTLHDVEFEWPEENFRQMVAGYENDFTGHCTQAMLRLVSQAAPAEVRARVDEDTCGNDPKAWMALFRTVRTYDQAAAMKGAGVPVWAINATAFPTAPEINRKYAPSFDVILMPNVGHYPQVEKPAEFQAHLRSVIQSITRGPSPAPAAR